MSATRLQSSELHPPTRRSIVIVGGGFAGLHAAIGARDTLGLANNSVQVHLINPTPDLVVKPRLYERDLSGVSVPLADLLEPIRVRLHVASADQIDSSGRTVTLDNSDVVNWDELIIASGSKLQTPEGQNVHCVDTLEQAKALRAALEARKAGGGAVRITVVGGGFTGLEVATELASEGHVTLVSADGVADGYRADARKLIVNVLRYLEIRVCTGSAVAHVGPDCVRLLDGSEIASDVVVWATGPRAASIAAQIAADTDESGRLLVDDHLRVAPGIWAAGDAASARVSRSQRSVMSCQHAIPQGRLAGENAAASAMGARPRKYRQPGYLTCLSLGSYGALLTSGFDRRRVLAVGEEGARFKRAINLGILYPRLGTSDAVLKNGIPRPPATAVGGALFELGMRSNVGRELMIVRPSQAQTQAPSRSASSASTSSPGTTGEDAP